MRHVRVEANAAISLWNKILISESCFSRGRWSNQNNHVTRNIIDKVMDLNWKFMNVGIESDRVSSRLLIQEKFFGRVKFQSGVQREFSVRTREISWGTGFPMRQSSSRITYKEAWMTIWRYMCYYSDRLYLSCAHPKGWCAEDTATFQLLVFDICFVSWQQLEQIEHWGVFQKALIFFLENLFSYPSPFQDHFDLWK